MTQVVALSEAERIKVDVMINFYCKMPDFVDPTAILKQLEQFGPSNWHSLLFTAKEGKCSFCQQPANWFNNKIEKWCCQSCLEDFKYDVLGLVHTNNTSPVHFKIKELIRQWADRNYYAAVQDTDYFEQHAMTYNQCDLCKELITVSNNKETWTGIALATSTQGYAIAHLNCAQTQGFTNFFLETDYFEIVDHYEDEFRQALGLPEIKLGARTKEEAHQIDSIMDYENGLRRAVGLPEIKLGARTSLANVTKEEAQQIDSIMDSTCDFPVYVDLDRLTQLLQQFRVDNWVLMDDTTCRCYFCEQTSSYKQISKDEIIVVKTICISCYGEISDQEIDLIEPEEHVISTKLRDLICEWVDQEYYTTVQMEVYSRECQIKYNKCSLCPKLIDLNTDKDIALAKSERGYAVAHADCALIRNFEDFFTDKDYDDIIDHYEDEIKLALYGE